MNSIALKKTSQAVAWVVAIATALAFSAPSASAFESRGNTSSAKWVSQTPGAAAGGATVVNAAPGDVLNFSLTVQNTSPTDVFYGANQLIDEATPYVGAHELRIGATADTVYDNIFDFSHGGPFVNNNRFATFMDGQVMPGQNLTFNWSLKVKAGLADGTYRFKVGMVQEYDAWLGDQPGPGAGGPNNNLGGRLGGTIFWDIVIGGAPATPSGALTISASGTQPPAANLAFNNTANTGANANFTRFTLTPAAGTTASITSIYVTRDGLSTDTELENIKIIRVSDNAQVGNTAGGFDALHRAQVFFSPALQISSATDFYIRAGVDDDNATASHTARLGVAANTDIMSNATSVSGTPVWGNYMTFIDLVIGTVTISEFGSVSDSTPDVGAMDVITNQFTLEAGSTEDISVEQISILKAGTANSDDVANIELINDSTGTSVGTVTTWNESNRAVFNFSPALKIAKGTNVRFTVRLDIVDGSGLTVNSDVIDGSDALIVARGDLYGYYITPTISGGWGGQGDNAQTINSGSLTISKSPTSAPTGFVAIADNQTLGSWRFDVRGEDMRITHFSIDLGGTVVEATDIDNARLFDANGNLAAGPVDAGTDGATAGDREIDFTQTFVAPTGQHDYTLKVKVANTAADAETITTTITAAGDLTVKGVRTGDTVTPTIASAALNTQTVKGGALTVTSLGNPATGNVIVGTADFIWSTFSFDAGASGEAVIVSAVTVTDTLDGTTGDMANIDNAELWADLDNNGSYEAKVVATPAQPTGGGGATDTHSFTLSPVLTVPKGGTVRVAFIADLATGATANGTHDINISAVTATGVDTGADIAETASSTAAGTMTVTAQGSFTAVVDASSPVAKIMIAGTTNNVVGAWKVTAVDEAFSIDNVEFDITSGGEDSIKTLTLTYPTSTGTATKAVAVSGTTVNFTNLNGYVGKDASGVITVTADLYKINSGGEPADFRDQVTLTLDVSDGTDTRAVGLSSGLADTNWGTDSAASGHTVYKTNLTVTQTTSGLSTTLQASSTADIYRFTVTADNVGNGVEGAGGVAIKAFKFSVVISDNGTTSATNTLGSFQFFRNGSELSASSAQITDITSATPLTIEDTNTLTDGTSTVQVTFDDSPLNGGEELIGSGVTNTYLLRATTGAGWAAADSASVVLLGDTTVPTTDATYLSDSDTGTGVQQVVTLQKSDGTQDNADVEFIWSDLSAVSHLSAFDDDGVVEESSADWTNGYLVKNFPMSFFGMNVPS